MNDYRDTVEELYAAAAITAQPKLCCTQTPVWQLPGLSVPLAMLERNYGCGTTVHPRDLAAATHVLYVGVGAGMEALQMSYFVRQPGGVIAIDKVPAMLTTAATLLRAAAAENPWFDPSFIELRQGDALALPVPDETIDLAAQNCLFNIFTREHLQKATYIGPDDCFDDNKGHVLLRDIPCGICDKTAAALLQLGRADLFLTGATWHYSGDGCC